MTVTQRHLDMIAQSYQSSLKAAYDDYAVALNNAPRQEIGTGISPQMLRDKDHMRARIKSAAGRLGAQMGAAKKWAKRELVFLTLRRARDDLGLDVTPTVALHVAERVLGRGVSMRAANDNFGQPERTASNKSFLTAHHLADLEATLSANLDALTKLLDKIRAEQRRDWECSTRREQILDSWRDTLRDTPDDLPVI